MSHSRLNPPSGPLLPPAQMGAIRQSFSLLEPIAGIAGLVFYQRLFEIDPSLKPLFRHDIEAQGNKLMRALDLVVKALDRPNELLPELEALGRRHAQYQVREEHYDTVGKALLAMLKYILGARLTAEGAEAWMALYSIISTAMKRGALRSEPALPESLLDRPEPSRGRPRGEGTKRSSNNPGGSTPLPLSSPSAGPGAA